MNTIKPVLFFIMATFLLNACGGGGGSSQPTPTPTPVTNTGRFVDSAVMGLHYQTATQSGLTNSAGEFSYLDGETVTFSLGGIELGSAGGATELTPLDLLGASSIDDANAQGAGDALLNMLVFLQSLDRDFNPDNGIDLGDLHEQLSAATLSFEQSPAEFLQAAQQQGLNRHAGFFISHDRARRHFASSQQLSYSLNLPALDTLDVNEDGIVDHYIRYHHDQQGRLVEITEGPQDPAADGVTPSKQLEIIYDAQGQLVQLAYNDVASDTRLLTRDYSYSDEGQVVGIINRGTDETPLSEEHWLRDSTSTLLRYEHSMTEAGVTLFDQQQNPFDLYYNLQPYNPNLDLVIDVPPLVERLLAEDFEVGIGGEAITEFSYDNEGVLTGSVKNRAINFDLSGDRFVVLTTFTHSYESGRLVRRVTRAEVEFLNVLLETEVDIRYSEQGDVLSCEYHSLQSGSANLEINRTLEPDTLAAMTTYRCGDGGNDQTYISRDDNGRIVEVIHSIYSGGNPEIQRNEQSISYEDGRPATVELLKTTINTLTEVESTLIALARDYSYNDSGQLTAITERQGLDTHWARSYEPVEIQP